MTLPVSSHAVANEFIKLAKSEGKPLTNMQLQKLVIIAQGYALALLGKPIFYHDIFAWQWGPVVLKLYKALQHYGNNVVTEFIKTEDELNSDDDAEKKMLEVIYGVWIAYGHMTGGQLSSLTHRPNTPWSIVWENNPFALIPQDLLANHYKSLLEKN